MNDTLKIEGCQDKINTKTGSILEIRLEAVPGSGYQWLLKDSSQLLQQLNPDSLKFTNPVTEAPAPGLPVQQVLHFKVMKKGIEMMRLEYKRIWEKETLKSCEIKIGID
ncbi:MAG: protease inhibitor I42 family protein [Chitinophagaceae bacterium]|nr:protease inhibitor I42 family protein [Chitinophagaceae bacterium]